MKPSVLVDITTSADWDFQLEKSQSPAELRLTEYVIGSARKQEEERISHTCVRHSTKYKERIY